MGSVKPPVAQGLVGFSHLLLLRSGSLGYPRGLIFGSPAVVAPTLLLVVAGTLALLVCCSHAAPGFALPNESPGGHSSKRVRDVRFDVGPMRDEDEHGEDKNDDNDNERRRRW